MVCTYINTRAGKNGLTLFSSPPVALTDFRAPAGIEQKVWPPSASLTSSAKKERLAFQLTRVGIKFRSIEHLENLNARRCNKQQNSKRLESPNRRQSFYLMIYLLLTYLHPVINYFLFYHRQPASKHHEYRHGTTTERRFFRQRPSGAPLLESL